MVFALPYMEDETIWQVAQTNKGLRKLIQDLFQEAPEYTSRYSFNLATRGKLLVEPPSDQYGGKQYSGFPHATSGYKWYRAARHGKGPIVLGALDDYQPMRDYTTYLRSEKEIQEVEDSAKYLMAFPWSLLVNAALVTGAIHGNRSVVAATDPYGQKALFKDPYGLTVYARELSQLILVHGYQPGPPLDSGYPEPATGGGIVLYPPKSYKNPATIFDVDDLTDKFGSEIGAANLLKALSLSGLYTKLTFDNDLILQIDKTSKITKKRYDKLRKNLKLKIQNTPYQSPILSEMLATIYPGGSSKALPSLATSKVEKFEKQLALI